MLALQQTEGVLTDENMMVASSHTSTVTDEAEEKTQAIVLQFVALVAIVAGIAYVMFGNWGRQPSRPAPSNLSEEEKSERRRRALARFGGGGGEPTGAVVAGGVASGADKKNEDAAIAGGDGVANQKDNDNTTLAFNQNAEVAGGKGMCLRQRHSAGGDDVDPGGWGDVDPELAPAEKASAPAEPEMAKGPTKDVKALAAEAAARRESTTSPREVHQLAHEASAGKRKSTASPHISGATKVNAGDGKTPGDAKKRSKREGAADAMGVDAKANSARAGASSAKEGDAAKKPSGGKKRPQPPPAQLLCEALSMVCNTPVVVHGSTDGWVPKRIRAIGFQGDPGKKKIVLNLPAQKVQDVAATKEDWARLHRSFQSLGARPFSSFLPAGYKEGSGLVAKAAVVHSKAQGIGAREIGDNLVRAFSLTKTENLGVITEGLFNCLSVVARLTASMLAGWLDKDAAEGRQGKPEEVVEDDLFADHYAAANARASAMARASLGTSAMGELFALSCKSDASRALPKKLLGDVMASSSDGAKLAECILRWALDSFPDPYKAPPAFDAGNSRRNSIAIPGRSLASQPKRPALTFDSISKDLAALSHLVASSPEVASALARTLGQEAKDMTNGGKFNDSSLLSLFSLGGYTAPYVGFETSVLPMRRGRSNSPRNQGRAFRFYDALLETDKFPLGYYDYGKPLDVQLKKVIDEARLIMGQTRTQAGRVMKSVMSKKVAGKDAVFAWLVNLAQSNEGMVQMLRDKLIDDTDEGHATLAPRAFLLGASLTALEICCDDLQKAYEKKGVNTFDSRYLASARAASPDERRLVILDDDSRGFGHVPTGFSGATEFFFAVSSLLRVGFYPSLRIRDMVHHLYHRQIDRLILMAKAKASEDSGGLKSVAALHVGWDTIIDDPELARKMVGFSILQLRYVADVSERDDAEALFSVIPESMIKLPAQHIASLAQRYQHLLTPANSEAAVRHATLLLASRVELSPQVRVELMRIASAFVNAGVQRELKKQRRRTKGRNRGNVDVEEDETTFINNRDLDIYTGLDKNDHGVTVFASSAASKLLGPALLQLFEAMDAVEGVDVEKEHAFHKNMVQHELNELILRLWCHPSGEFRNSITSMKSEVLDKFLKSVAAAICIDGDTAFQPIVDIRDILESHVKGRPINPREAQKLAMYYERLPSSLGSLRRLLLVLVYLSQDDKVAAMLGSGEEGSASQDLALMIMSLLDKFTGPDGGTNANVDFTEGLKRGATISPVKCTLSSSVKDVMYARAFAIQELGFEVSSLAHLLLALAARWTTAAIKRGGQNASAALIKAIATHQDFDIRHFQAVFDRLIIGPRKAAGNPGNKELVEVADGYVDSSLWFKYEWPKGIAIEDSAQKRKNAVVQDQLSSEQIDAVANANQIKSLLGLLKEAAAAGGPNSNAPLTSEQLSGVEQALLRSNGVGNDSYYAECLGEFLISSDSFAPAHFFASSAKAWSNNPRLSKALLKDARKVWKNLPSPHPNASVYVSYSEERMDLCKSMIVGTEGTPYSLGLFLFDICYPQTFPDVAPLVHFMTTGGGSTRFSPNLYNDGKVCLSILGTTEAGGESQRWNPEESSLAQVMLSISSQILGVEEPYHAEGGWHATNQRGTLASKKGSVRFNNQLRLSTLRYAIIDHLKNPPKGFEVVVRRHFAMCRKRLLVQAKVWTLESRRTELHGRFLKAYSELALLLSSDKLACEEWERDDVGGAFKALPPLEKDLRDLERLDHGCFRAFDSALPREEEVEEEQQQEPDGGGFGAGGFNDDDDINDAMLQHALAMSLQG